MDASLNNNIGIDIRRFTRQLQAVTAKITDQTENVRRHVIVREDDRVLLCFEVVDRRDQRRHSRPFHRGDEIADQGIEMIRLGLGVIIIGKPSGLCCGRSAQRGRGRTARSGINQSCHISLLLCST